MAVPFRRTSKSKKGMRRSHQALTIAGIVTCPNCGELTLAHRMCSSCGFYKGKQVVSFKKEEVQEETKSKKSAKK